METNLTFEAMKFMALGMGIVFLFLIVTVIVLKTQAKIIGKYFPEKKSEAVKPKTTASSSNNTTKVAAIVAAVQHHKNLKG